MEISHPFQGVACCCMEQGKSIEDTIHKLLDLKSTPVQHHDVTCNELKLANKYYETTIHLFDFDNLELNPEQTNDILNRSQAIILYGDGQKLTTEMLDSKHNQLRRVRGEPRILLYHGIDEDSEPFQTLSDWCLENEYDLIDTCDETASKQLIESLSAYKWMHRSKSKASLSTSSSLEDKSQLDNDLLKKLTDFDSLLTKFNAYRDRPELRGNPDDKNIEEIAQILSGLLDGDVDNFLEEEEGEKVKEET